jgi:hypothetical protein
MGEHSAEARRTKARSFNFLVASLGKARDLSDQRGDLVAAKDRYETNNCLRVIVFRGVRTY